MSSAFVFRRDTGGRGLLLDHQAGSINLTDDGSTKVISVPLTVKCKLLSLPISGNRKLVVSVEGVPEWSREIVIARDFDLYVSFFMQEHHQLRIEEEWSFSQSNAHVRVTRARFNSHTGRSLSLLAEVWGHSIPEGNITIQNIFDVY